MAASGPADVTAALAAERIAARNLSNVNFATTPTEGGTSLCKASGTALTAAPTSGALLLLTLVNDFNALVAKHNALLVACQTARVCT